MCVNVVFGRKKPQFFANKSKTTLTKTYDFLVLWLGYDVVVVDNLINAARESLTRVEKLTNRTILQFYQLDIRDGAGLDRVFNEHKVKTEKEREKKNRSFVTTIFYFVCAYCFGFSVFRYLLLFISLA